MTDDDQSRNEADQRTMIALLMLVAVAGLLLFLVALVLPQVLGIVLVIGGMGMFGVTHYVVWGWWLPRYLNRIPEPAVDVPSRWTALLNRGRWKEVLFTIFVVTVWHLEFRQPMQTFVWLTDQLLIILVAGDWWRKRGCRMGEMMLLVSYAVIVVFTTVYLHVLPRRGPVIEERQTTWTSPMNDEDHSLKEHLCRTQSEKLKFNT